MDAKDIKPGVEIVVPRGADGIRKAPYRLRVDKILENSVPGRVHVSGTLFRLSGAPSAKRGNARLRVATLDPAKIRLATEEDGR